MPAGQSFQINRSGTQFQCLNTSGFHNVFIGQNPSGVHVAIAGSVSAGVKWQIGGGGQNGQLAQLCSSVGALTSANSQLKTARSNLEQESSDLTGCVTPINLKQHAKAGSNLPFDNVLYSSSPDLNGVDEEEAKRLMQQFGRQFRESLNQQGVDKLVMPLFSGGIYSGGHDKEKIAKWMMQGWFAQDEKLQQESGYVPVANLYFAAPQFSQSLLQEAQQTCGEALVGTKTRAEAQATKTAPQQTTQATQSGRPRDAKECAANLMSELGCEKLSIVTSPAGNPQAKFSFESAEEMQEAIEKLRDNEKLKNPRNAAGEPWQIKQEKDGTFSVTLRSSETYLLAGFGKGDQENFRQTMQQLKTGLESEKENTLPREAKEAAREAVESIKHHMPEHSGAGEREAAEAMQSMQKPQQSKGQSR